MTRAYRYAAFISYSSRDDAFARRLIGALENYRIPASLGRFTLTDDPRGVNRLYPCFRDREELGSGDLGRAIERALDDSNILVVVCSPHAARSEWVDKEIRFFANLGRGNRIFAVIAAGEPNSSDAASECFPPALRTRGAGALQIKEVVAGDARPGKDGFRNAWLKLVAGAADINLGRLLNRDRAARHRQAASVIAATAAAAMVISAGLGWTNRASEQIVYREQASLAADVFPLQQARLLLAATRGATDILPSPAGVEAALEKSRSGTVRFQTFDLAQARISPDGRRLAVWGQMRTDDASSEARLLDLASMRSIATFSTNKVVFSPASDRFVAFAESGAARLHNSENGALIADLGEAMNSVLFSPDGEILIVGAEEALLVDPRTGRTVGLLGPLYPDLSGALFAGDRLLVQSLYERWTWRSAADGRLVADLGAPASIVVARDGSRFITLAPAPSIFEFGNAVLRDREGRVLRDLGQQLKVAFSPDGALFATRALTLELRSSRDGSPIAQIGDERDSIAFSPDGSRAVVWSSLGAAPGSFIDARNGRHLADLSEMSNDPTDLDAGAVFGGAQFSPNGHRLLTAFRGHSMMRDGRSGALVREDVYHSEVLYSPDDRWVLVTDSAARLLDSEGRLVFEISGVVASLDEGFSFSNDGRFLLMPEGLGMALMDLDARMDAPWPRRRGDICQMNRDAIGGFGEVDRGMYSSSELRRWLRGRPWHPCDWRGVLSADGWAQLLRYWAVRAGAQWDYQADECDRPRPGFGCPRRR
jgi:WD40 repeat protein